MWPTPGSSTSSQGSPRLGGAPRVATGEVDRARRRLRRRARAAGHAQREALDRRGERRSAAAACPAARRGSCSAAPLDSPRRAASRRSTTPAWATAPASRMRGSAPGAPAGRPRTSGRPERELAAGGVADRRRRGSCRAARRACPRWSMPAATSSNVAGQPPRLRQPSRRYSRFQTAQPRPARSATSRSSSRRS